MDDSDIEALVRRYRPVGPPARLRERILATRPTGRTWPWAAAALLAAVVALRLGVRHEVTRAGLEAGATAEIRVAEDLAVLLGGDVRARALAAFIVAEGQARADNLPADPLAEPFPAGAMR